VDLGILTSAGAATSRNITTDGSGMSGKLTVNTAGENDTVKAGTGGSAISKTNNVLTTADIVSITFNTGVDQFNFGNNTTAQSAIGSTVSASSITNFTSGIDKIGWNGTGTPTFNTTKVDVSGAATLADALDLAAASTTAATNGVVRYFNWGSDSYVVADQSNAGTFTNSSDSVIKLVGVTTLSSNDFILS
jgi:S-layer protein